MPSHSATAVADAISTMNLCAQFINFWENEREISNLI